MYFHAPKGPMPPGIPDPPSQHDRQTLARPHTLHERKLFAWVVLTGGLRSSSTNEPRISRPHRGMLPDVDFSRVAADDCRRLSLLSRLQSVFKPPRRQTGRDGKSKPSRLSAAPGNIPTPLPERKQRDAPDDASGARRFRRAA